MNLMYKWTKLILFSALLFVSLMGCDKLNFAESGVIKTERADSVVYQKTEDIALNENGRVQCLVQGKEGCLILYGEEEQTLYYLKKNDMQASCIPVKRLNAGVRVLFLSSLPDGKVILLIKDKTNAYFLLGINAQGEELFFREIPALKERKQEKTPLRLMAVSSNSFIILYSECVQIFKEDGRLEKEIACDGQIVSGAVTSHGEIICAVDTMKDTQICYLDKEKGVWKEKLTLEDEKLFNNLDCFADGDTDYDFYFRNSDGIYGYDMEQKRAVLIVNLSESGIAGSMAEQYCSIGEETFIFAGNDAEGHFTCAYYNKVKPEEVKEKKVIRVAKTSSDAGLEEVVAAFNRTNKEYKVEIKNYNVENGTERLLTEIISGNGPDVIGLSGLPLGKLEAIGVLEDLTPYYEQDKANALDEIIPSVREAMKSEGKIYYVADSFQVLTCLAKKRDIKEKTGWNTEEFIEIMKEKKDRSRPFYNNIKNRILLNVIDSTMDEYIEWKTGQVTYDSESFKTLLAMCNEGIPGDMDSLHETDSEFKMIKDGKVYLGTLCMDNVIFPMVYLDVMGNDVVTVGYPCADKNGSYFQFFNQYGINTKSTNKEGAWEFVKEFMRSSHQSTPQSAFPTRKDCFENLLKSKKASLNGTYDADDLIFHFDTLSDEGEAFIKEVVNGTHKVYVRDESVEKIIMDEAQAYFNGDRPVDETVKIIQSRVQTYVNEQK